jgi:hypothetical protein
MVDTQDYANLQKRVGIALLILFAALIIFAVYFLVYYEKPCNSAQCFVDSMASCKRVYWIREDPQGTWMYTIKGNTKGTSCKIEVELLEVKKGLVDVEELTGKNMICVIKTGQTEFPEKDLSKCSGSLKEGIQDLIIQRMHKYLLENVGEIKKEFDQV